MDRLANCSKCTITKLPQETGPAGVCALLTICRNETKRGLRGALVVKNRKGWHNSGTLGGQYGLYDQVIRKLQEKTQCVNIACSCSRWPASSRSRRALSHRRTAIMINSQH